MNLTLPCSWLELALLALPAGLFWSWRASSLAEARQRALLNAGLHLLLVLLAWLDFYRWSPLPTQTLLPQHWLATDALALSVALLSALQGLMLVGITLKTRRRRFSFARTLLLQWLSLLLLMAQSDGLMLMLLGLLQLVLLHERRQRGRSLRLQGIYVLSALGLSSIATFCLPQQPTAASLLLLTGLWIYTGLPPFQSLVLDHFERASLGTALLSLNTLLGVYALLRLLPADTGPPGPVAAWLALLGALYCAGQACIQSEGRRFVAYFSLSHQALIVAGLLSASPLARVAGFALWFNSALSLMTLGLIFRSIEARKGRLSLRHFGGLARQTPVLAALFLLMALSATGFPGSPGFWGLEALLAGTSHLHPLQGLLVLLSSSLNSIAAIRAYGQLFLGTPPESGLPLQIRRAELLALMLPLLFLLYSAAAPQVLLNHSQRLSGPPSTSP